MSSITTQTNHEQSQNNDPPPPNTHFFTTKPKHNKTVILQTITQPFQWLQNLSTQLNPTFILGIFLIHGLQQGFTGSFFRVAADYYWKDIQKLQPSLVQIFAGIYFIPWVFKPLWGILTDAFPIRGYRRRPYFIGAGVIGTVSGMVLAAKGEMAAGAALACFVGVSASMAIAEVTIDACIARNSIEVRSLAPDLQSLCSFCSSFGALVGFVSSGFFVHHLGPQGSLGIVAVPPALTILLGFVIYERRTDALHNEKKQEFVGEIYAVGAFASILGVMIYHKALKDYPFRTLIFYAQLLYTISGVIDLFFILRWNLKVGIPDYIFVIIEESCTRITGKIKWMPMLVLSTQLCPLGIEGTFFALLMCIDSIGGLISKWGGGLLLHAVNVSRTDFTNLWFAVFIRDLLRFGTLAFVFLVPKKGQSEGLLPSELSGENVSSDGNVDEETLELVPTNVKNEV
ncbi:probable folate-biopterin transporter 6 isoform X3 [Arachis ipaensis]|uniref:probable folate-biopterin transporter 6 isoform X3 n=1 Tax=Arachis ipaensis TaxID=130454 RepID=UPI000A2B3FD4|nr:probable folate-biopterin transporter 6 isoform X3 [Arachis ipaensis]XP_025659897.1 probable folate-biopterin transporter 6 isoform X3 [Arachis hypogaea]